jgi:hypothetical protein
MRFVHSVLDRTPHDLIEEIVLVDDGSTAGVIVFVLTPLELEPTVNRTRCEYANQYITDMGQITDRRQTYKQSLLS